MRSKMGYVWARPPAAAVDFSHHPHRLHHPHKLVAQRVIQPRHVALKYLQARFLHTPKNPDQRVPILIAST